ncbi:CHRD domain-containing protein [Solihabitans fulvus]|uniref:CHRD domain-containing protein n=1 Tax=Solihabitans fulvus TaxID=1892852 RepID=A0A5B2W9Y3_9PSEU|nr:CHRD domain-containing protein [Solihabitans fulvus]KAA2247292.1 CHRD domain-containing protein [Solihabitans fulvus]
MRVRLVALSTLVFGLSLVAGTTAQAAQSTADSTPSTMSSTMPGMTDMPGMTGAAPPSAEPKAPDRAAGIQRARQRPVFLKATLEGRNEVQVAGKPPVGDPKGSATGLVRVQGDRVTFAFSWKGISAPTLGHIHQGASGANGDVKVPLFTTAMPDTVTSAAGSVTVTDPAVADALRADPAGFYLNLHTKEFPGGAVRGQLGKLREAPDLLELLQGGDEKAFLSGDQEVPVAGGPAVGDRQGHAVAFVRPKDTQVAYSFAWLGIAPTLGHIHRGNFGSNGPVVVPLFTTPVPSTVFAVSGTATGLDPALVKDISEHPASFYANLHSAQFPGGAVRGQLYHRDHDHD